MLTGMSSSAGQKRKVLEDEPDDASSSSIHLPIQDLKKLKVSSKAEITSLQHEHWTPTKFTISTRSQPSSESSAVEERYKNINGLLHQFHMSRKSKGS